MQSLYRTRRPPSLSIPIRLACMMTRAGKDADAGICPRLSVPFSCQHHLLPSKPLTFTLIPLYPRSPPPLSSPPPPSPYPVPPFTLSPPPSPSSVSPCQLPRRSKACPQWLAFYHESELRELVWPGGKAQKGLGSIPLRLSLLLKKSCSL